jgi:hypothetical protein
MNITVKVDEVSLSTAVGNILKYDGEDGPYAAEARTVGHLVAEMIVDRLTQDGERWYELSRTVTEIKREVIREAVLPMVEQAITEPIQKTSAYGDPIGDPVTLREVIVDEARKVINSKDPNDYRGDKGTFLVRVVREEVSNALRAEIADAVKQAKALVAGEIGQQVAAAVTNAMKGR